jgi:hypothetical protein
MWYQVVRRIVREPVFFLLVIVRTLMRAASAACALKTPAGLVRPHIRRASGLPVAMIDAHQFGREVLAPVTEQGLVRAVDHHDVRIVCNEHGYLLTWSDDQ